MVYIKLIDYFWLLSIVTLSNFSQKFPTAARFSNFGEASPVLSNFGWRFLTLTETFQLQTFQLNNFSTTRIPYSVVQKRRTAVKIQNQAYGVIYYIQPVKTGTLNVVGLFPNFIRKGSLYNLYSFKIENFQVISSTVKL